MTNRDLQKKHLKSAPFWLPWLLAISLAAIIAFVYFLPSRATRAVGNEHHQNPAMQAKPQTEPTPTRTADAQPSANRTASTPQHRHLTDAERAVLMPKPIALPPGTVLPLTLDPKSNLGIVLGPSVGSLAKSPKPRPLPLDLKAWKKLPALEAIMTPRTHDEAAWMDLYDFPTEQEMDEQPLMPEAKSGNFFALNRLRELAVQVAIVCQRNDEKLCEAGVFRLTMLGHPFGTRLTMIRAMEKRPKYYRNTVILACQIGHQLGDDYQPHRGQYQKTDWEEVFSMPNVLEEVGTATSLIQSGIPAARAMAGLPPLRVIKMPFNRLGY